MGPSQLSCFTIECGNLWGGEPHDPLTNETQNFQVPSYGMSRLTKPLTIALLLFRCPVMGSSEGTHLWDYRVAGPSNRQTRLKTLRYLVMGCSLALSVWWRPSAVA